MMGLYGKKGGVGYRGVFLGDKWEDVAIWCPILWLLSKGGGRMVIENVRKRCWWTIQLAALDV